MSMMGLSFFKRDSGGGLTLVSRHPLKSLTWYWALRWSPYRGDETRRVFRVYLDRRPHAGQRNHTLHLLRLGYLMLSTQAWHKKAVQRSS